MFWSQTELRCSISTKRLLFARFRRTERRTETESRRFHDRAAWTDPQADAAEHSLTSDWSGGAGGVLRVCDLRVGWCDPIFCALTQKHFTNFKSAQCVKSQRGTSWHGTQHSPLPPHEWRHPLASVQPYPVCWAHLHSSNAVRKNVCLWCLRVSGAACSLYANVPLLYARTPSHLQLQVGPRDRAGEPLLL